MIPEVEMTIRRFAACYKHCDLPGQLKSFVRVGIERAVAEFVAVAASDVASRVESFEYFDALKRE